MRRSLESKVFPSRGTAVQAAAIAFLYSPERSQDSASDRPDSGMPINKAVDEDKFKDHFDALVRQSVEKTVNSPPTRKTHSCPEVRDL